MLKAKTRVSFAILVVAVMVLSLVPAAASATAGAALDVSPPQAEFHFNRNFTVHNRDNVLTSGPNEGHVWYGMHIHNSRDASGTVLGDLSFSAQADGIQHVAWEQYAVWDESSVE